MSLLGKYLYRFGPFDLDAEQRLVRRDGAKIPLPPKAFDVLLYLVRNPLRLVTKEELLREVWPDSFVEEGNLSQNIFLLRKAWTATEGDPRYIVTIPGRGYQFASAVEMVSDPPAAGIKLSSGDGVGLSAVHSTMRIVVHEEIDDASPSLPTGFRATALPSFPVKRHRWWPAGVAIGLLAIAAGSFFWWNAHRRLPSNQTIVLSDFENHTGDGSFDIALKKALEIDLAQSPYLNVMSDQEVVSTLQLMGRPLDAALTPSVTREVCQRSDRQVVVGGSIANLGSEYLVTLEATDCSSGKKLTEAKAEAVSKEKVLAALDSSADKLRHGLGESAQSVERFQVPIARATTSSLEALKAYSIGEYMVGRTGKEETETLPVFQRAVELDPQFAMAYAAIGSDYYNLSEYKLAAPYYQKAFDLSDHVSEKERLYIRAHYYADTRKDIEQGLKEYQLWAETYPRDWGAWLNIANEYTQLGQYAPAIAAGEHAVRLDSTRGINYSVLARAYMRVNRYADAKAAASRAVAIGKDSYGLHATLYEIAFVQRDQAAMAREAAWGQGRPSEWFSLYVQASAAMTAGKYKQGEEFFHDAYKVAEREGLAETADDILIDEAIVEFDLGLPATARATLTRVKQPDLDNHDLAFLKAELGDTAFAERSVAAYKSTLHPETLVTYIYLPRLQAEIDLQRGKALDAIAALDTTTPYELAGGFTIANQRGRAYLLSGQDDGAIGEYKKILDHRGVDPISPLFPLAHLRLARIYKKAQRLTESRSEYETFFSMWNDADKTLPLLQDARREYDALKTSQAK